MCKVQLISPRPARSDASLLMSVLKESALDVPDAKEVKLSKILPTKIASKGAAAPESTAKELAVAMSVQCLVEAKETRYFHDGFDVF